MSAKSLYKGRHLHADGLVVTPSTLAGAEVLSDGQVAPVTDKDENRLWVRDSGLLSPGTVVRTDQNEVIAMNVNPTTGTSPPAGTLVRNQAEYTALGYDLKYIQDVVDILPPGMSSAVIAYLAAGTYLTKPSNFGVSPDYSGTLNLNGVPYLKNRLLLNNVADTGTRNANISFIGTSDTTIQSDTTGTVSTNVLTRTDAGTWTVNALVGQFVYIVSGAGAGSKKVIEANDATTLTVPGSGLTSGAVVFRIVEPAAIVVDSENGSTLTSFGWQLMVDHAGTVIRINNVKYGTAALPGRIIYSQGPGRLEMRNCMMRIQNSGNWPLRLNNMMGGAFTECAMYLTPAGLPISIGMSLQGFVFSNCLIYGVAQANEGLLAQSWGACSLNGVTFRLEGTGSNSHAMRLYGGVMLFVGRIRVIGGTGYNGFAVIVSTGVAHPPALIISTGVNLICDNLGLAVFKVQNGIIVSTPTSMSGSGNAIGYSISNSPLAQVLVNSVLGGIGAITEISIDGVTHTYSELAAAGDAIAGQYGSVITRT